MQRLRDDLRDAFRGLRGQPRFLIIASLTLALGVAAVTVIFSVVNSVLLKPLPYPHAERLVNIRSSAPGIGYDSFPLSPDLYFFYKRHAAVFEDMALFQLFRANVTEGGPPEVVDAARTTHTYFTTLGIGFAQGRPYSAEEDAPTSSRVAAVSHRLWTRRYGSDPSLVGRAIRIDGVPTVVVGISPGWLDQPGSPDVWVPARFNPANPPLATFAWSAIGRLKPGVRPDQGASNLEPLVQRALTEYIQSSNYRAVFIQGRYRPLVHDMKEDVVGNVREPLWILFATVGILLLVACGNVANLCLIRGEGRQRELAVRSALGGSRQSLIWKLLVEALVLSAAGTALGVVAAWLALPMLLRAAPNSIPRLAEIRLDGMVFVFAALIAVVSALIFGAVPAIRYTRPAVLTMLRHGGRSATDHPDRQRGRQLLVIAQTAMALVLLVGSGLLARSFARLIAIDQGFVPDNVMTFRVALPETAYPKPPDAQNFTMQLVERLSQLAGVEAAGATSELPLAGSTSGTAYEFEGQPLAEGQMPPLIHYSSVTSGYFTTLRIPLLRGSNFDTSDYREGARNVIVNKAAADKYWPVQDALGKRFRGARTDGPWYVVKGVVADVRHEGVRTAPRPLIYFPLNASTNNAPRTLSYVVRGPEVERQADLLRQAVWALNPDLPLALVQTMDEIVERSMVQFTFTMVALGTAAAITMLLGAIGLYGVLSYAVTLRTREIGVKLALGAPPARVKRAIMFNAATIMTVGLVVGVLGAAWLTRFLEGQLFETQPLDPVTFASMAIVLWVVGLLAAYLPARKAASLSPMEAMRTE
jgi:predicted permease